MLSMLGNMLSPQAWISINGDLTTSSDGTRKVLNNKETTDLMLRIAQFEAMKLEIISSKKINTAISSTGTKYYFDATLGDDANDGLSEVTAWKTLSKINLFTFNAGDALLLKRGEVFHETINITSKLNGTSDNWSTLGAYGEETLHLPIIEKMDDSTVFGWVDNGDGTWTTQLQYALTPRLIEDNIEILKTPNSVEEPLSDYFRWHGRLDTYGYIDLFVDDPSLHTYRLSGYSSAAAFYDTEFLHIQDIEFQGGASGSIRFTDCNDIDLENVKAGAYAYGGIKTVRSARIKANNYIIDSLFDLKYDSAGAFAGSSSRGPEDAISCSEGSSECEFKRGYIKDFCHSSFIATSTISEISDNIFTENYCTAPNMLYGGRVAVSELATRNTISNNYIKDIAVRNQVNGTYNTFRNNIVNTVRYSPIKTDDISQGIMAELYGSADIHHNEYSDNIFIDCHDEAVSIFGGAGNTYDLRDNVVINNISINCGVNNGTAYTIYENDSCYNNLIENNTAFLSGATDVFAVGITKYSADNFNSLSENYSSNTYNLSIADMNDKGIVATTGGATKFNGTDNSVKGTGLILDRQEVTICVKFTATLNSNNYIFDLHARPIFWSHFGALQMYDGVGAINIATLVDGEEYDITVSIKSNHCKVYNKDKLIFQSDYAGALRDSSYFGIGSDYNGLSAYSDFTQSQVYIIQRAMIEDDVIYKTKYPELFFRHCNSSDTFSEESLSFSKTDCILNIPLNEAGTTKRDYAISTDNTMLGTVDATNDVQGASAGLQRIYFNEDMTKANTMGFDATQADQIVTSELVAPYTIIEVSGGVHYAYVNDGTSITLYTDLVGSVGTAISGDIVLNNISQISGANVAERKVFQIHKIAMTSSQVSSNRSEVI